MWSPDDVQTVEVSRDLLPVTTRGIIHVDHKFGARISSGKSPFLSNQPWQHRINEKILIEFSPFWQWFQYTQHPRRE
jgi:hypothetical protein